MNQTRYQGTRITEPPTLAGVGGEAWRLTLPDVGQRATPDLDCTVGGFLIRAPERHAFWDHWLISVTHLRVVVGARMPVLKFPGATHELLIVALNPERPLPQSLHVGPGWRFSYLEPIDVVEQFIVADDAIADTILERAARCIVDGHASPDQDARGFWKQTISATAAHFNDGVHHARKA